MQPERRHRLEAGIVAVVGALVRCLPRRLALALGSSLARVYAAFDRRHVAIAADNLRRAFPEWDQSRVQATAFGVYRHFGRVAFDLLWMQGRSPERIMKFVRIENEQNLRDAFQAGRGAVGVTAHIGNWEVHALAHGLHFSKMASVARPLDNPWLDARLVALRALGGNVVISKHRALQEILRWLRSNGFVGILLDQNTQADDGIFVQFFGQPACTTTVAAALAAKTGCGLAPCRSVLEPDGTYRLIYDPALQFRPTGRRQEDIARLTQELTAIIEGWVRERPEQWLWLHRRWKTKPGDPQ